MTRVRDEVRSAFEREQAQLGDVADARHRLLQAALAERDQPASRGLQWAAAVAAIVIAAIVIATFAIAKANNHSRVVPATTPSPRAQASPTPLRTVLNVSASTPIIVYADPFLAGQLDGVTWDGKQSGKLADQQLVGAGNPQNDLFAGTNFVDDRTGATVMTGTFGTKVFQGMWADDGRHICLVTPFDNPGGGGVPTKLQMVTIGGATRDVAQVGTLYNQTSVRVVACSTANDRAVVVQSGGQGIGTAQIWAVQLSTGRTIWTHSYDPTQANITVVSSRDGNYVAEDLMQAAPAGSTVLGADGNPVVALADWVEAFSGDGKLAVVDGGLGLGSVRLVSWRDGRVVWAAPYRWVLVGSRSEPDGGAMAIWAAPSNGQQPNLYVVGASGNVITEIDGAQPLYP